MAIKKTKAIYSFVLLFQLTAFSLEMLPIAVMAPIASGPNKWVTRTFSYFDLTLPFGCVNFSPSLIGILGITVIISSVIILILKKGKPKLQNAAYICSILALVLSILQLSKYGWAYISTINYIVTLLILLSLILQIVANRYLRRTE
jgi:hypothetical protein